MEEYYPVFSEHLGEATMELYNRIPWEWFFSGSSEGMSFESLRATFGRWRSLVANITKCQVAAMGLIARSPGGNNHVHAMLVGKNRHGKSLADVGPETVEVLEGAWKRMARSSAKVLPAFEERAVHYIVQENLLYKRNVEELTPINTKLLRKLMEKRNVTDQPAPNPMADCCPAGGLPGRPGSLPPHRSSACDQAPGIR